MKKIIWALPVLLFCAATYGQELYVNTEPASNMASGSIGFRVLAKLYKMNYNNSFSTRLEPEVMLGAGRRWMIHFAGYGSDMYQKKFRIEGASLYAKYRFYSRDDVHEHFRIAAFSKISVINNPQELLAEGKKNIPDGAGGYTQVPDTTLHKSEEFDIDGNNSGILAGAVATRLINKVAISASASYGYRLSNFNDRVQPGQPLHALNYTASVGYLLLPREYTSYYQTNVNLYMELLGATFPGKGKSYADIAPAIQFIFKSIARLDLSYRTGLAGNIQRLSNHSFMVRLEYNLLNVF